MASTVSRAPDDDGCVRELPVDVREAWVQRVRLQGNEVHLWWGRTDAVESLDALEGWLSEDELRRSERFRRERDARAFVFRRAFLRAILATQLGCRPGELVFAPGPFGKPLLAHPAGALAFSASSSGARVLVAVTEGQELGVDVERLAGLPTDPEELSRLAARVLGPRERAEFAALAPGPRRRGFLRAWTRKEALLKALGIGLAREPSTVEVGLASFAGERVLAQEAPWAGGQARLYPLEAPPGSAASLVVLARMPGPARLHLHGT